MTRGLCRHDKGTVRGVVETLFRVARNFDGEKIRLGYHERSAKLTSEIIPEVISRVEAGREAFALNHAVNRTTFLKRRREFR